jgi:hypothetical protein
LFKKERKEKSSSLYIVFFRVDELMISSRKGNKSLLLIIIYHQSMISDKFFDMISGILYDKLYDITNVLFLFMTRYFVRS